MCWQLQAISIFCSEFSVTIVAAESLYNICIIHIIPGYPVDYVYLHIITDLPTYRLVFIALHHSVLMTKIVQWWLSPSINLRFS
jgi:hypothetical protein